MEIKNVIQNLEQKASRDVPRENLHSALGEYLFENKQEGFTGADIAEIIQIAGKRKSESDNQRRIDKPSEGASEKFAAMLLHSAFTPHIENIREKFFGSRDVPFKSSSAALKWLERTAKQDEKLISTLAELRLGLGDLFHESIEYPVKVGRHIKIHRFRGSQMIGAIALIINHIANKTRFENRDITLWLLRGIKPKIERLEVYDECVPGIRFKAKIILNSPDITWPELWSVYRKLRKLPDSKKQAVGELHFRIFQLVQKRGGPPKEHGRKQNFWTSIQIQLRKSGIKNVPTGWEGIRKAYYDLLKNRGFGNMKTVAPAGANKQRKGK